MGHLAVAAFAAVDAIIVTSELAPLALQGGEPYPQQTSEFASPGTGRHGATHDLQCPTAINRRGQSPSFSPQKAWIFFEAISSAAASARPACSFMRLSETVG